MGLCNTVYCYQASSQLAAQGSPALAMQTLHAVQKGHSASIVGLETAMNAVVYDYPQSPRYLTACTVAYRYCPNGWQNGC